MARSNKKNSGDHSHSSVSSSEDTSSDESSKVSTNDSDAEDSSSLGQVYHNLNNLGEFQESPASPSAASLATLKEILSPAKPKQKPMLELIKDVQTSISKMDELSTSTDLPAIHSWFASESSSFKQYLDQSLSSLHSFAKEIGPATFKKDANDQKKVSETEFLGTRNLLLFKEDIRAQTLYRRNWPALLTFKHGKGTYSVLDDFLVIDSKIMANQRKNRSAAMKACSENMYLAIWSTLGPRVKSTILEHKKAFKTDGPSLLYYLLRKFTGEQTSVIRVTLGKYDKLTETFNYAHNYNVDRFATYVFALEEKLRECEGHAHQNHEKVYEALITSHVPDFNQELKVWRSTVRQTSSDFTVESLLIKAREHYQSLIARKAWPKYSKGATAGNDNEPETRSKRRRRRRNKQKKDDDESNDIAALFANFLKSQEKHQKELAAHFSSAPKSASSQHKEYAYDKHFGPGKDFKERHELMSWVHTAPVRGTTKELHGITWTWCKYCEKMGYHPSSSCRRKNAIAATDTRKRKGHANVARTTTSTRKDPPTDDEYEFTDTDSDYDRKPAAN